ncbi:MAG: sporulation protein YtfJ [Chloroflexi bacterium]|nr:sporulation protein YtfJ [Chloroflexota bacterium]
MAESDVGGRLSGFKDLVGVDRVFGRPEVIGEKTIIPVARVSYGFGGGFGRKKAGGGVPAEESDEGGGGGGGASIKPVAILEVTPGETKLIPIVDVTRVAICAMLLIAWNVFWVTKTVRCLGRK